MGFTHGITRDDVFTAASEIFASGRNPTQSLVRAKLQSGSFSTITKYLAEWREQQTEELTTSVTADIPEEVNVMFHRFYNSVIAQVEAKTIAEQVNLLETENEFLKSKVEDYDSIKAELAGLKYAYNEAMTRLEQFTRENERINKYAPQIDKVESVMEQCNSLINENEKLKGNCLDLQLQVDSLNNHLKQSLSEVENLQTHQKKLTEQLQRYQVIAAEVESLKEQTVEAKATIKKLHQQLGAKQSQMLTICGEVVYLAPEVAELVSQILTENEQLKSLKTTKPRTPRKPKVSTAD